MEERREPVRMSSAPEHAAPPAYRPLSALAVTALVVALLLGVFALGLWWLAAPGLLLGVLAWTLLADGRKRGRGLALAAALLSLGIGVLSFMMSRAQAHAVERSLEPLVRAMAAPGEAEARRELERWAGPAAGPDAPDRWRQRLAAAGVGRTLARLEVGSVWLGPHASMIAIPRNVAEVPPLGAPEPPAVAEAIWIRAHFESGAVWIALVPEGEAKGVLEQTERLATLLAGLMEADGPAAAVRVRDVRVFRSVD